MTTNAYNDLIKAIKKVQNLSYINEQKMNENIEEKFIKLTNSKEIEILTENKINEFLDSTIKGKILKTMGFTAPYIKDVLMPIVNNIGPEIAEIYLDI